MPLVTLRARLLIAQLKGQNGHTKLGKPLGAWLACLVARHKHNVLQPDATTHVLHTWIPRGTAVRRCPAASTTLSPAPASHTCTRLAHVHGLRRSREVMGSNPFRTIVPTARVLPHRLC